MNFTVPFLINYDQNGEDMPPGVTGLAFEQRHTVRD